MQIKIFETNMHHKPLMAGGCQMIDQNLRITWKGHVYRLTVLIHWGRLTHIWFSVLTIIASGNYLPFIPDSIIWASAGILLDLWEQTSAAKFQSKFTYIHLGKCTWKFRLENCGHFVSVSIYQIWTWLSTHFIKIQDAFIIAGLGFTTRIVITQVLKNKPYEAMWVPHFSRCT